MRLVIPYSKTKRYLSGFDWVMGIVDIILKSTTCAGNISQIVLTFDSSIKVDEFKKSLTRFIKLFPVLKGRISRDLNLAPYWKFPGNTGNFDPDLSIHHLEESSKELSEILDDCVNQGFPDKTSHVRFHLIYAKDGCYLAITFDHLLLDGRGAELFVNLFQQYLTEDEDQGIAKEITLTASADLSEWTEKFEAGKQVNRKIIALSQTPVRGIPLPPPDKTRGFRFKIITFDLEQTEKIYNNAYEEAGYLMEMPFLLATTLQTMHELFEKRRISNDTYLIPLSIDMRSNKDTKQELFFNYASMMFFQINCNELEDRRKLIKTIKEQLYEQVQSKFAENLLKASALLRIAPFFLLKRAFELPFEGKMASFCFAHVGNSAYRYPHLMGDKITNLFHMPRVPVPPGLGLFFNAFGGQLNATITWLDGLLTEDEIELLETGLSNRLFNRQK